LRTLEIKSIDAIKRGRHALAIAYLRLQIEIDMDHDTVLRCTRCGSVEHHADNHPTSPPALSLVSPAAPISHAPTSCVFQMARNGALYDCGEVIQYNPDSGAWYHVQDRWTGDAQHPAMPGPVPPGRPMPPRAP
jgi:hypothetical protein